MNERSIIFPLFWSLLVIAIVGGIVAAGFWKLQTPPTANMPADSVISTQPARLIAGHDYYILVKLVELTTKKPNGSRWDRGFDIAPDPKVLIHWHGQRVYQSSTRQDTFIATWDLFRVNIADVIRSGGNVDIASSINAPIIRDEPGAPITIEVWDTDVMFDDLAMRMTVPLETLHLGDNNLSIPAGTGVRRLIVQVIDRQTSLGDLVNIAQAR